ncbi:molybdenum cofactor biosynthesis protein MoeB [bacterium F16]|nr:molybdenum cofactor biosynthesis protein MoeB [bacterium F16]
MSAQLSTEEIRRYQRHVTLPEVGEAGQLRLKQSSILVVGAGGLGSPAAMYLAAAGVGRLGLGDFDTVDESNLHRQILHGQADVGRHKLSSAEQTLKEINPYVELELYRDRLTAENAPMIFEDYDVILGGTDNFAATYLCNDACVMLKKPFVYGSIFQFQGQTSVFAVNDGPCYRCLFPEPPASGSVPDCAAGGVFGVLPGVIGTIQATEAIKVLLGIGKTLSGQFMTYDALNMEFKKIALNRDPGCPVCGNCPTITALANVEVSCSVPTPEYHGDIDEVTLAHLLASDHPPKLLDVREPWECQMGIIGDAVEIPLGQIDDRCGELDPDDVMVVYCKAGVRSQYAIDILGQHGFKKLINLAGGYMAWQSLHS